MNIHLKSTCEGIKNSLSGGIKNPKILIIGGLLGIMLIFLSQCNGKEESVNVGKEVTAVSAEEYRDSLENEVKRIVTDISGDENPTVVVTLESGIRYSYADVSETSSSVSTSQSGESNSENSTRSYITVRDPDGGEKALLLTEIMPKVRGVAVICNGGDDETTAQKIEGAVTAAFNITSKRVYIAGGKGYEKR